MFSTVGLVFYALLLSHYLSIDAIKLYFTASMLKYYSSFVDAADDITGIGCRSSSSPFLTSIKAVIESCNLIDSPWASNLENSSANQDLNFQKNSCFPRGVHIKSVKCLKTSATTEIGSG